ncbi:MAG TPA: copper chaperone PCu(A)C [Thermoanaerobaculia bacterium]|nr:copper chaperone PCu(A)C [Thermoanaerobaculia bacterium]
MRSLAFALVLLSSPAWAQVEVENPWSRATAPGAKVAAGYMVLHNKAASQDRLVSASTPLARKVETHVTTRDGDIMRMREVKGYEIPANGRFELKPGGPHLMFVDVKKPFAEGDVVPVSLRFEKAGEKKVEFRVGRGAPGRH